MSAHLILRFVILLFASVLTGIVHPALSVQKTAGGLLYGDNFNDGIIDTSMWEIYRDDTGITVIETGGEAAIFGIPEGNCASGCGNGFVGFFATPYIRKNPITIDAVMAGKLKIPSALDQPLNPVPGSRIEFHYCNVSPDVNVSVGFQNNYCTYMDSRSVKVTFDDCDLFPAGDLRAGFKVHISYNNGFAKAFIDGGDSIIRLGDSVATNLNNHKRMELKAIGLNLGEALDYRYEWAAVYKQPRDFPVILIPDAGLKNAGVLTAKLSFGKETVMGTGTDTIRMFLPEHVCYPVGASLELLNGNTGRGSVAITTDGELEGLYPGDTYTISSISTGLSSYNAIGSAGKLTVFPNPFVNRATFRFEGASRSVRVAVYNVSGKRVFLGTGRNVLTWDAANLPAGVYTLRAGVDGKIFTKRLVLAK